MASIEPSPSEVTEASPTAEREPVSADGSPSPEASASPEASPSPIPEATGAVASLQDVENATIFIEAQGSFRMPDVEVTNSFGAGSGFIIDPSGLAITNNHVVTGAGTIDVMIGDEDKTYGARILGVSECSDLALIDIDGDGFPYLEWADGDLLPTTEVYAAGFPLGDPTYAATRGSINKLENTSHTEWASIPTEVVHDANLNPGNSGGPLVNAEGKVVGVNYASHRDAGQYFAIAPDEAQRLIEEFQEGKDVASLGINGTAVYVDDSLSGIWVASVKSGSPADKALIKAGDFITRLEGLRLATDGTMKDYCKVLRQHKADDTLSVEVFRLDNETYYEGQINGRELAEKQTFEQAVADQTDSSGPQEYSDYTLVKDASGTIQVSLPVEWSAIDDSPWVRNSQEVGVGITASADLEAYNDYYTQPGMDFLVSRQIAQTTNENQLLDQWDQSESCTKTTNREQYSDALYTGVFDAYSCPGDSFVLVLTFVPENRAYVGVVYVQGTSDADIAALRRILDTFEVIGTLN